MTPEERATALAIRTLMHSPEYGDAELVEQVRLEIEEALRALLEVIAGHGTCKGCNAPIYWVKHVGKLEPVPYSHAGINHFIDCPQAKQFKRRHGDARP
jgi:hypothetical protein